LWAFEIGVQKFVDHGIGEEFLTSSGVPMARMRPFVDDGDAVGDSEREVAIVRDDQRGHVNAFLEMELGCK